MVDLLRIISSNWRSSLRLCTAAACLLGVAVTPAAIPVDGEAYSVSIRHELLSEVPLGIAQLGLEIRLTLHNAGTHRLHDVRISLTHAGEATLRANCEPARLRSLAPGASVELTWTFECLIAPLSQARLEDVRFRVQAVDQRTQQIVAFTTRSREGR